MIYMSMHNKYWFGLALYLLLTTFEKASELEIDLNQIRDETWEMNNYLFSGKIFNNCILVF